MPCQPSVDCSDCGPGEPARSWQGRDAPTTGRLLRRGDEVPCDQTTVRVLEQLPDGTVRQQSPLTGTVVWTVPGRSNRPIPSALPAPRPLPAAGRDATCAFCSGRYLDTPPERSRLVLDPAVGGPEPWRILRDLPAEHLTRHRRGLPAVPEPLRDPAVRVLARQPRVRDPGPGGGSRPGLPRHPGRAGARAGDHADPDARQRARPGARSPPSPGPSSWSTRHRCSPARTTSSPPAGTSSTAATMDDELASSGDLTPLEHHAFVTLTVEALADMNRANPFARYVAAFQNWLRPAGASFDHLHKQLVAIDEYGPLMTRVLGMLRDEPDLFNTAVGDPAARDRLVIAENEHCHRPGRRRPPVPDDRDLLDGRRPAALGALPGRPARGVGRAARLPRRDRTPGPDQRGVALPPGGRRGRDALADQPQVAGVDARRVRGRHEDQRQHDQPVHAARADGRRAGRAARGRAHRADGASATSAPTGPALPAGDLR